MSKELIEQLRDLANCRHDDLSIGYEAADRIEQLETERDQLREQVKMLREVLEGASYCLDGYYGYDAEIEKALAATEPKE